jgi:hypothetical protein
MACCFSESHKLRHSFPFIILNNLHILYLPPTHIFLEIQLIIPNLIFILI